MHEHMMNSREKIGIKIATIRGRRQNNMLKYNRWRYDDPYFCHATTHKKRTLRKPRAEKKAILHLQLMILSKKTTPDITKE
jgi:hypothetical protein